MVVLFLPSHTNLYETSMPERSFCTLTPQGVRGGERTGPMTPSFETCCHGLGVTLEAWDLRVIRHTHKETTQSAWLLCAWPSSPQKMTGPSLYRLETDSPGSGLCIELAQARHPSKIRHPGWGVHDIYVGFDVTLCHMSRRPNAIVAQGPSNSNSSLGGIRTLSSRKERPTSS